MEVNFKDFTKATKDFQKTFAEKTRLPSYLRKTYIDPLLETLDDPEVEILAGIRRCGKSTLLVQLAAELLERRVPPQNIAYFSLDDSALKEERYKDDKIYTCGSATIDYLLETHRQEFSPKEGTLYCFLDEVQAAEDWEHWLKGKHDSGAKIKFFVTGSSSKVTSSASGHALTGRHNLHRIFPFSFREYLEATSTISFEGMEQNLLAGVHPREAIKDRFKEYLKWGGFPKLLHLSTENQKEKTLRGYFDDILNRDIVPLYPHIRNPESLRKLARYLVKNSGSRFSANKLAKTLGIATETAQDYLEKLLSSNLFQELRIFDHSEKRILAAKTKIYCIDHGLVRALSDDYRENLGNFFEPMVFIDLLRRGIAPSFFSDERSEIDFVWQKEGVFFALESDSSEKLPPSKTRKTSLAWKKFKEKNIFGKKSDLAYISGDDYSREKERVILPLWLFLLTETPFAPNIVKVTPQQSKIPTEEGMSSVETNNQVRRGIMEAFEKEKTMQGIVGLIDMVNFAGQSNKLGPAKTQQVVPYFENEAERIITARNFSVIKKLGDAILFFGENPADFTNLFLDLYVKERIPPRYGFTLKLRMTAHSGFFTLVRDADGKVDLIGSNTTKTFRLEKHANPWECLVTNPLYQGLSRFLEQQNVLSVMEKTPPLKGFEIFGDGETAYRLIPPVEREDGSLCGGRYRKYREELSINVQTIPIFINLFDEISMEDNFINLALSKEWQGKSGRGRFRIPTKTDELMTVRDKGERERELCEDSGSISAKDVFHLFNKGLIFGFPGAGKTTVLRHFTFLCFEERENPPLLFVNCRDVLPENIVPLCKRDGMQPDSPEAALKLMVLSALYPSQKVADIGEEGFMEVETAFDEISDAWRKREAIIFLDALDETPTEEIREQVYSLTAHLMQEVTEAERTDQKRENRVFLTSRPGEFPRISTMPEPVFNVKAIDLGDIQRMASFLYRYEPDETKEFLDSFTASPWVREITGTPLTAMLMLVYYETMGRFGLRYDCYDLLLKFILKRVWMMLKKKEFGASFKDVPYYLKESSQEGFLDKFPQLRQQYDALSSLSWDCLFDPVEGESFRSVEKGEIIRSFRQFLLDEAKDEGRTLGEGEADKTVNEWMKDFCREHLLIPAGHEEYIFLHSTAMEFLAGRWMELNLDKHKNRVRSFMAAMVRTGNQRGLESLPILCGKNWKTGHKVLGLLQTVLEGENEPFGIAYRCLVETERAEKRALDALRIQRNNQAERKNIEKSGGSRTFIYEGLRKTFEALGKSSLEELKIGELPGK
ncbi:MAG: AAA family ATPase, partial [Nitrospinae bacterium]|nr:AAA family ATPase [Nitrospinota bacterium]